jgi:hypothetical protein
MNHHRHHPGRHTWRLVLARLCLDPHAEQIVTTQVGDCWQCWRAISDELVTHIWSETIATCGIPQLHPSGLVEGRAISWICTILAGALDAAALDAQDEDDAA